ncbi:MAG: PaaI family thioesterase [Chitinophagales bacterium]|nr:PaaI family thioesterase [Chitinophagales bacterium]MDW8419745.1 PaaI family thioesterase [Chitinophagales bacterium]
MKSYEPVHPKYKEYTEYKISLNRFMHELGFVIDVIRPGYTSGYLVFHPKHAQQNGWLHGGITAAILDMVEGFAAYSLVPEGQQVFTVDARVAYYNPGIADKFYARGWVDKPGKRFHFCEGELYYLDNAGNEVIVAKGTSTMAIK